jgi:DNA repair protein RadD
VSIELRDYQLTTNREVWKVLKSAQSVLLQAPTGAGKTVLAAHLIAMRLEHAHERTLVLAHRREIVRQTANKLADAGVEAGIIMADHKPSMADVQVASIDTLWARRSYNGFPDANLLVLDECHRSMSKRYHELVDHYKKSGAKILGLTATPMRNDGQGLGKIFEKMVRTPDIPWLVEHGYLVPVSYRVGIVPDVKGVKLTAGDYNRSQLEAVMNAEILIGDIVENWMAHAKGLKTMLFASGVAHSMHLRDQFLAAGVKAVHIDGDTPTEVRDKVFEQINAGEIQVICNAMVYVEGTDIPCIECIVDGAPSKSLIKVLQAGGRGMRTFPGKKELLYLDHSGNIYRHGVLGLPRDWELTEGKKLVEKLAEQRKKTEKVQIRCGSCGLMHNRVACPRCGVPFEPKGEARAFLPAVLVEMTQWEYEKAIEKERKKVKPAPIDKQQWYSSFLGIAAERNKSRGFAAHLYRSKFLVWPRGLVDKAITPTKEARAYEHSRRIAYAKSKAREAVTA